MKKLVILILLMGNVAWAETVCKEVCAGVTDEQKACVMKSSCEPKIAKLRREVKELKAYIDKLEKRKPEVVEKVELVPVETIVTKVESKKTSVGLLAGYGPLGTLREDKDGTDTIFRTQRGLVLGLQLSRVISNSNWSGMGQLQTNGTPSLGLLYSW